MSGWVCCMCATVAFDIAEDCSREPHCKCLYTPPKPLALLTLCPTPIQSVELKNGDTYNGTMVNCDTHMNMNLKGVIRTSAVRVCGGCVVVSLTPNRFLTWFDLHYRMAKPSTRWMNATFGAVPSSTAESQTRCVHICTHTRSCSPTPLLPLWW